METFTMEARKEQLSNEYEINSLEWWERYFGEGIWSYYDGGNQTLFFSKVAWEHIDSVYIEAILQEKLSICDVGCAEGECVSFMQNKFPESKIVGIELTEHAVNQALHKFPECHFICAALETITDTFDVVFSSNVLEHLRNPEQELQKLFNRAEKFLIVMCPVNDNSGEPSHINIFDKSFFYQNCPQGGYLAQLEIIDTSILEGTHWIGEQVLVVYEKEDFRNKRNLNQLIKSPEIHKSQINLLEQRMLKLEDMISEQQRMLQQKTMEYQDLLQKQQVLQSRYCLLTKSIHDYQVILEQKDDYIHQCIELCAHFATGKLMQLNHLMFRIKGQLLQGDKSDRKDFWAWIKGRTKHTNRSLGAGSLYNPLMVISSRLQKAIDCLVPSVHEGEDV